MSADLQQLVEGLKAKHEILVQRYQKAAEERDRALKQVADLEYTVRQQQFDIEKLQSRVEFLTIVSNAMPDRDDVEKSRALLTGLVREIDKCINDLTD